jgi:hypothetical protein
LRGIVKNCGFEEAERILVENKNQPARLERGERIHPHAEKGHAGRKAPFLARKSPLEELLLEEARSLLEQAIGNEVEE